MSNWKQIKIPEDPNWEEWHKELTTPIYGHVMLKIWKNPFAYMASITKPNGKRIVRALNVDTAEYAKVRAVKWAIFND